MHADPERGMPVGPALDVDVVGVLELLGVAVGRGPRQEHPVTFAHRASVELGVLGDGAGQRLGRGEEPQELLDRLVQQARVVDELLAHILVLVEPDHRVGDERRGRGDATGQQQVDDREDLVVGDRTPVDLLLDEVTDHVVGGVDPAVGDGLPRAGVDVGELDLDGLLPVVAARHRGEDHAVGEGVALPVGGVQTDPVDGDDRGHADDLGHVARALLDDLVDEPRDVVADHRLHPLDGGGSGDRVDELAPLAEVGRVDLDGDVEVHGGLGDDHRETFTAVLVARRRERRVVSGGVEHRAVAGEHPIAAVSLAPRSGVLVPDALVGARRVGRVFVGVVVEMDDWAPLGLGHGWASLGC